ncbi:DUF11 domain-containing protein [Candidatus Saccharibacteria bacterium]|nr:MAG: DUF11 domain-containing protein [Candidatus Saccharibacteria bacterium]
MTFAQLVRKVNTRAAAVAALAFAVVAVPAGLLAWGPSRPTFTMANPAPYITFNSITDATNYGDERNFVMIQGADGKYTDDVTVENGKEYSVRIYVHNNAASNLNLVARDVVAKLNVPTQTADRIQIDGYVNASNANPTSVWDQAVFHGANGTKFNLSYVAGSAFYKNAVFTSGTPVADSIVSGGAKLGYNAMDGNIPGCFQYSGVVYLKVKATTTDFNLVKTVRKGSTGAFTESVAANPGDTVEYQLYFKNTGGTNQTNVTIKDVLPADMEYVPGTTYVHDSLGTRKVADGVTVGGMTMGSYLPQGDVYIKFAAKVKANDQLDKCGENTLVNTATATTNSGNKSDTANVVATKTCVEPKLIDVCRLSDWKIVRIDEKDFDTSKYSKDTANCHPPVVMIDVCRLSDKKIVRIDETTFDSTKYSKDLSKCAAKPEMVEACNLDTKKIETVEKSKIDNVHYTLDKSKCDKPVEYCTVPGKESLPKNSPDCKTTTTTPNELPHTGIVDGVMNILGLSSLAAAVSYYIASRKLTQN